MLEPGSHPHVAPLTDSGACEPLSFQITCLQTVKAAGALGLNLVIPLTRHWVLGKPQIVVDLSPGLS